MTIEGHHHEHERPAPHPHEPPHDGHHHPQIEKGLASGSVGLLGGTVLGISSVAPAYALTATIGLIVAVAGVKMPIIIIAGFLPMFFAAYAYREFNKVDPDCGTSFTWTTRAFGPYVGWMGGWVAVLATIIVLANLAGIGVQFLYQLLGSVFNNPELGDLWTNRLVNVLTCLAFLVDGHLHRLSRDHHHREGAVRAGVLPARGARAVRGDGIHQGRRPGRPGRHPVLLGLVQPLHRSHRERAGRRPVGVDLLVLGLGHRADGQRGIQGLREDTGPGRPAVCGVDPADLPAGLGRHPDVRRGRRHRVLAWPTRTSRTTCSVRWPNR